MLLNCRYHSGMFVTALHVKANEKGRQDACDKVDGCEIEVWHSWAASSSWPFFIIPEILGEQQSFVASTWKVTGTLGPPLKRLVADSCQASRSPGTKSCDRSQQEQFLPPLSDVYVPMRCVETNRGLKNWSLHLVNVWYSFRFWPLESFENLLYLRIWRLAKGRTKLGRIVWRRMVESWTPRIFFYCARPAYRCLSWVVQAAVEFGCSSLEHGHIRRVIVVE